MNISLYENCIFLESPQTKEFAIKAKERYIEELEEKYKKEEDAEKRKEISNNITTHQKELIALKRSSD
jgi:hypothetical protein